MQVRPGFDDHLVGKAVIGVLESQSEAKNSLANSTTASTALRSLATMLTTPPGCLMQASTTSNDGVFAPKDVAIDVMPGRVTVVG